MISKTEIKQLSRLSTKKGRNEYGLYLIEGLRIIRSALGAKVPINRIFVTARFEKSADYQSISNRFNQILKPEFLVFSSINSGFSIWLNRLDID